MREILFKAKRLDSGEWVEGYYLRKIDPLLGIEKHFILKQGEMQSLCGYCPVFGKTVCQSTGKRDKKGVQIFEGDVARLPAWLGGDTAVCKWVSDDSSVEPVIGFAFVNDAEHIIGSDEWDEFEIIGNIYDKEN